MLFITEKVSVLKQQQQQQQDPGWTDLSPKEYCWNGVPSLTSDKET